MNRTFLKVITLRQAVVDRKNFVINLPSRQFTIVPLPSVEIINKLMKMESKILDHDGGIEEKNEHLIHSKTNETDQDVFKLSKRALKRLIKRKKKTKERCEENGHDIFLAEKERKIKDALEMQRTYDLINEKTFAETQYYFENGLRKVYPYYFDFVANAKGRWIGRNLVEVFSQEFQNYSEEKCRKFIQTGTLTVFNMKIDDTYIIQNGDIIVNRVHRHELPVANSPVNIVAETDDLLVVDKPSSMPIHPCGRYRHNSLLYILAREYGYMNLRVLHRLDRLTSGLLMMGKNLEKTSEVMEAIRKRELQKVYLAKVDGVFPDGTIECNQPLGELSQKLGVYKVDPHGKESTTIFNLVATDGVTSIVQCQPKTGRTHQIRIHLQYLGYPISNDPLYNGDVWGPEKGKNAIYGKSREQLINDIADLHKASIYIDADRLPPMSHGSPMDDANDPEGSPKPKRLRLEDHTSPGESIHTEVPSTFEKDCPECLVRHVEPKPDQMCIYLHALSYEGHGWKYSTSAPSWARYE